MPLYRGDLSSTPYSVGPILYLTLLCLLAAHRSLTPRPCHSPARTVLHSTTHRTNEHSLDALLSFPGHRRRRRWQRAKIRRRPRQQQEADVLLLAACCCNRYPSRALSLSVSRQFVSCLCSLLNPHELGLLLPPTALLGESISFF
jgi:hypothetical protein